jgi:hypothetical protein
MTIDDVSDDDKPDILVANTGSGNVGIFLNIGDGNFTSQITYSTDSNPFSVALIDVNDDDQLDIIVGHEKNAGI